MDVEAASHAFFCREVMLPIWEQWTNGDPAARQLLETAPDDAFALMCCMKNLLHAQRQLLTHAPHVGALAAVHAGWACFCFVASRGSIDLDAIYLRALHADARARD
jgi:hypothetical protein